FYHQVMPVTSLTRGALLDLLLLAVVFGAGFAWLRHIDSILLRRVLWLVAMFVTCFATERGLMELLRNLSIGFLPVWAEHLPWIVVVAAAALLLFAPRYYDFATKATEAFLLSAGLATLLVVLPQLVYACFNHAPPEQASFARTVPHPWHPGEPRIVWVLFDELSYDQVFDHRETALDLPAFTSFRQESVSFSQLAPIGDRTELIIPSLFLGRPIAQVKSNRRGALLLRSSPGVMWQSFTPEDTVFAEAQRQGWGTGVAGWYNPYCRILATVLDRCYWTHREFAFGGRFNRLSSQRSVWANARDGLPLIPQIENAWGHTSSNQSHRVDYRNLLGEAKSLISDENIRFAFVHLPVPHPPGIFADPAQRIGEREDYLGNLILADRALAELRAAIAKTSAASDTIFIISSDHSWRVSTWRGAPGWTKAEERATGGGIFDPRPVLMVHFPGQNKPEQIDRPQSETIVHDLLLDLIAGKVRTLAEWIDTLPGRMPAVNQAD
ncbi:MAG: sulfatase-like hydrolase/transferase, partial [Acidobacteriaceae bacterium]